MRHTTSIGFVLFLAATTSALAADIPVAGTRVLGRTRGTSEKLVFLSRDAAWRLSAPIAGGPGTLRIDVSTPLHPDPVTLHVPPLAGRPGWSVRTDDQGTPRRYRFRNSSAPNGFSTIESIVWSSRGSFKLVMRRTPLDASTSHGGFSIRISDAENRHCARFGATTIVADVPGNFSARNAPATALADCSPASLGETESAPCVSTPVGGTCGGSCGSDAQCTFDVFGNSCSCAGGFGLPCGESDPVCNGYCPVGMHCGGVSPSSILGRSCGCVPDGATACGDGEFPTCGGACSDPAMVCRPTNRTFSIAGSARGCSCNEVGACAEGSGLCGPGADCPPGQICNSSFGFFGCFAGCVDP